jgi:hypothetical protein
MQTIGLDAALGGHRAVEKPPKHLPRHADPASVLADIDAEHDGLPFLVAPRVIREVEKHLLPCPIDVAMPTGSLLIQ